jgi:hypothetical protein
LGTVIEILGIAWAEAARMSWFTVLGVAVAALSKARGDADKNY